MKKSLCAIIILAAIGTTRTAAQPLGLNIEECRELALENNRIAKAADQTYLKAENIVGAMRANFLPQLSMQGLYIYSTLDFDYTVEGGQLPIFQLDPATGKYNIDMATSSLGLPVMGSYAYFPNIDLNLRTGSIYYAAAQVRQPVFMGGKITAGYRMAKIGREMAELNRRKTDAEIVLSTDEAYWNCVRAKVLQSTAEQYLQTVEEFYTTMSNAVAQGMRPTGDLLKVEIKRGEAELNLTRVMNAQRLAAMNLCNTIGLELLTEIEVDTTALSSMSSAAAATDWDITQRPEYGLLQKQVEMKRQEVAVTQADFLPQIGVQASYGYMNGIKLNDTKVFNHTSLTGMVSVSIPIFHWGEGLHKTNAAKAEQAIAELQRQDLEEKMMLEVQMYRNACDEALLQVKIDERILASALENMRVMQNRYDQGMETVASLLEAQTQWQKASTDLVEAKVALRIAETGYLKAAGLIGAERGEKGNH